MSRFVSSRRRPTLRDLSESRATFDRFEREVTGLEFQRHERFEDEAEHRRDCAECRTAFHWLTDVDDDGGAAA